ncbi:MAG: phosphopentomutase, partial [Acutalibacteraceae bacterium]
TLKSCFLQKEFSVPTMQKLGLFNVDGVDFGEKATEPAAAFGRFREASKGKDTTTGHWEICGIISEKAMPTYPDGFPKEIIDEFSRLTGRGVLCNKPYSGTKVIADYGEEHLKTGALIVYTSADSVFQIAAHESIVPPEKLYEYCKIARKLLCEDNAVGRVIARPFEGEYPFKRTARRHDFSLEPPEKTLLDSLSEKGFDVISVGKIYDIFAGKGITESHPTKNNSDGMEQTYALLKKDFHGLCFVNLVDFDMVYGHRNDAVGYAKALSEFDRWLSDFLNSIRETDVVMITADHGCDPLTQSTDHSREYIPLLIYGKDIKPGNLGTRSTYADIGKTVAELLGAESNIAGKSFINLITEENND